VVKCNVVSSVQNVASLETFANKVLGDGRTLGATAHVEVKRIASKVACLAKVVDLDTLD